MNLLAFKKQRCGLALFSANVRMVGSFLTWGDADTGSECYQVWQRDRWRRAAAMSSTWLHTRLESGVSARGLVLQPGRKLASAASALSVVSGPSAVVGSDAHCSLAGYSFWKCHLEKWKHLLDFHSKQVRWCSVGTWLMDEVSAAWVGTKTVDPIEAFEVFYPEDLRALLVVWLWVTVERSFWNRIFLIHVLSFIETFYKKGISFINL